MHQPKALICCLENWDTLMELPFVISAAGFQVDVFCSKQSWLLKNSYYSKWIQRPDKKEEWLPLLMKLATEYTVVIPADEKLLIEINNATDNASAAALLPLKKMEHRYLIGAKSGLSEFCSALKLPTPNYIIVQQHSPAELEQKIAALQFPVLVKPDAGWGGGGIAKFETIDELRTHLHSITNRNIIVQEFKNGRDIGIEALFKDGRLLMYTAADVITYFDSPFGFTTRRRCFTDHRIEELVTAIGQGGELNGFASIQMIESEGTLYIIECDCRPNFWIPYNRFAGFDFSRAFTAFTPRGGVAEKSIATDTTDEIAIFYRDIIRCINQKDVKGIFRWLTNYKRCWRFIPTYDRKLFRNILYELMVVKVVNKIAGKKH